MTSETGPGGMGGGGTSGGASGGTGGGPSGGQGPKRGLFDDLAGMAGGAFSVLAGARAEAEAMGRAQLDAMVQRLDLVKREDLDAALEVARRAREQAEALETRVAALEARLTAADTAPPANDPGLAADGG
ncbi:accessory factor UbiK family protein [Roseomonas sp. F4]